SCRGIPSRGGAFGLCCVKVSGRAAGSGIASLGRVTPVGGAFSGAGGLQRKEGTTMFLRIDRLAVELPMPKRQDPASAASVQELLGGRFGEMSTLMNYTYQSFNLRSREKVRPYYALIANIAAE